MLWSTRPFASLGGRRVSWEGSTIGRFRVDGVLGRGGMGLVLRAYDPQLERPVAIKILTERAPNVAEGTTVNLRESVDHDGLLDEARALAQVADPNVLAVYEIGSDTDKSFLVMELVEGRDAREWLAAKPRTLAEILDVFAQAGRGLAAAHRRGVIHRDFKPENVLISADGRVRVCDFGIAAFARSRELIRAGRAGTPRYMAPELWGERAASIASDVYAYAISLVEAICGEPPESPALADEALAKRTVGPRARAVIVRALDPDPARRPSTIDEIVRAFAVRPRRRWPIFAAAAGVLATIVLVAALRGQRDESCGDTAGLLASRWNAGERALIVDAVLGAGGSEDDARAIVERIDRYGTTWTRLRGDACKLAEPSRRAARLSCLERRLFELSSTVQALRKPPTLELAIGRSNALGDLSACIEATAIGMPSDPEARKRIEALTTRVVELYDKGLAKLGSEGDQAELERGRAEALELGDVQLALRIDRYRAQLAGNAGKRAEAERILDEAYALAVKHRIDSTAGLLLVEGAAYSSPAAAKAKLDVARTLLERSPDATPFTRMKLAHALARNAMARGALPEAQTALDDAEAAIAVMEPRDPLWTAQTNLMRIWLFEEQGDLGRAREVAATTATLLRSLGRQGVPDLGDVLAAIGRIETMRGDRAAALGALRERLALLERHMPPLDSGRVGAETEIGRALLDSGEIEEARALLERNLEKTKQTAVLAAYAEDLHNYLARAERLLGNYDRARLHLESALTALRARAGERAPEVGMHEITFAIVELEAGDFEHAATHARIAEDVLATRRADHVDRLDLAEVQIWLAIARGRAADADAIAERTLALLAERRIEDARVERFLVGAAAAREARGRISDARTFAEQAVTRRRARKADPLELAVAEVELAKARHRLGEATAAADLGKLATTLDTPSTRFERAMLVRWLRAHRLQP